MTSVQSLADALAATARQQGETTPTVRGGDWQMATVTAVHTDGTLTCGQIRARRLDSYLNPAVGDLVALLRSGTGNWLALDRLATTAGTAWDPWTPTWTTSSGSATPSYGNATVVARYVRLGRTVHFRLEVTFGSTTNFGGGGTGDNWRFALPIVAADTAQIIGFGAIADSSSGIGSRTGVRVRLHTTSAIVLETSTGRTDGAAVAGPQWGLVDAVSPWTWADGDAIFITGTYETA